MEMLVTTTCRPAYIGAKRSLSRDTLQPFRIWLKK